MSRRVHSIRVLPPEKPPEPRTPTSPAEWQHVANLATALLEIDSCKQYGLMEGGAPIDAERCRFMIEQARHLRIYPQREEVLRIQVELVDPVCFRQ